MSESLHIVGICGSIRKESYNRMLLNHARKYLPEGTRYSEADITSVPYYNQDMEADLPPSVLALSALIQSADGILISSPEYNFSFPGVLKNALEWLSRAATGRPLTRKHIALMGASTGHFGPARGYMQLRQLLYATESLPVLRPEVFVANAMNKFDEEGRLIDSAATDFLEKLIANLILDIQSSNAKL